jgi:hypothetical protein
MLVAWRDEFPSSPLRKKQLNKRRVSLVGLHETETKAFIQFVNLTNKQLTGDK